MRAQGSLHAINALLFSRFFFFFNDTATTEIYTLSLHDALPISSGTRPVLVASGSRRRDLAPAPPRSEEHTSELQSPCNLVCRLLLEKKNTTNIVRRKARSLACLFQAVQYSGVV